MNMLKPPRAISSVKVEIRDKYPENSVSTVRAYRAISRVNVVIRVKDSENSVSTIGACVVNDLMSLTVGETILGEDCGHQAMNGK
jgi:hypothetical protein